MLSNTNENIEEPKFKVEIASKFEKLFLPKRYKVFYGGRGGAKTVTFTKIALVLAVQEDKKFLCLREFMNSIDESVHNSLKEEIDKMGIQDFYKVREKYIDVIDGRGGFRYNQLARNLGSLKSKRGFNVAWVEEAETISNKSLQTLIPTIREDDSELWFSFNPESEQGAVYAEFVKPHIKEIIRDGYYEDQDLLVVKVGLEDNPFDTPTLTRQSEVMKETNYRQWLHIFGGECYADYEDAIIKPEWVDAAIDAHIKIGFKPMGIKSLGFDPADTGDDKAYALRHGSVVTHAKAWSTGELPEAIDIAFDAGYDLRAQVLVYDADGLGAGIKVGLNARLANHAISVQPYRGGAKVDNPEHYYPPDDDDIEHRIKIKDTFRNKRAQYLWYLRDRFEATYNAVVYKIYTDPANMISLSSEIDCLDQIKAELITIQRVRGNSSLIQIESKQDLRGRDLPSYNLVDAINMAFANELVVRTTPEKERPDY